MPNTTSKADHANISSRIAEYANNLSNKTARLFRVVPPFFLRHKCNPKFP